MKARHSLIRVYWKPGLSFMKQEVGRPAVGGMLAGWSI